MSPSLVSYLPPWDVARDMPEEDLAAHLLKHLLELPAKDSGLNRYNLTQPASFMDYAAGEAQAAARAITEAWMWLEREGFLAPRPGEISGNWSFVTRKAQALAPEVDLNAYKKGKLLPRETLDPIMTNKVRPLFLRGDYDTAVFRAFKEVETRVRSAGKLPPELIGSDLLRKAFHPIDGSLTDSTVVEAERQALSHLFAGAIGLFKNPSSHRGVQLPAEVAAQAIALANLLLAIVQERVKAKDKT